MGSRFKKYFPPLVIAGDFILLNGSFLVVYFFFHSGEEAASYMILLGSANAAFFMLGLLLQIYHFPRRGRKRDAVFKNWKALLLLVLLMEAGLNIFEIHSISRPFLLTFYFGLVILLPLWRFLLLYFLRLYRKSGYNYKKVVIAGGGEKAHQLMTFFESHPEFSYRLEAIFDENTKGSDQSGDKFRLLNDLPDFLRQNDIDEIYCSVAELDNKQLTQIMSLCDGKDLKLRFLPALDISSHHLKMDFYGQMPVLSLQTLPLDNIFSNALKRSFDIIFSSLAILLVLSWLLPLLALLIRLDSKGPAFYRQKRTGINNREFWCFKLRTMRADNPAEAEQATTNDNRITGLGAFLRKTNLDEYPQFFNVLLGDMSIVGPRPHMIEHTEHYSQLIDQYMVRHFIKPGITGLSQIKGFRGETINPILMQSRIKEDIFYLRNWSFLLDIKIILLTILNMLKGERNAY